MTANTDTVRPMATTDIGALQFADLPQLREAMASMPRPPSPSTTTVSEERLVPGLDGGADVGVRVYRPAVATEPVPVVVWIHGGGYIFGSGLTEDVRLNGWAETLGCVVVSVDYRLSPEHAYPAPIEEANVRTVAHLGQTFNAVSGLSDHAPGSAACVASIALGGSIIEKHFTISRADGGPDVAFSLEPHEFKQLVDDCKSAWLALGSVDYGPVQSEKANTRFRRSIYAVKPIKAGEPLTNENIRVIRPGFGLPPKHLPDVIGRT